MIDLKDRFFANMPEDIKNQMADLNLIEALENDVELYAKENKTLKCKIQVLKEENSELKESLIELDPTYGDIVLGSDRAYEIKYD
jgi:predicted RNase H-like nuclease (RuvC/YqgF family)